VAGEPEGIVKRLKTALTIATIVSVLLLCAVSASAATKRTISLKAASSSVKVGQTLRLTGKVGHAKAGVIRVVILKKVGKKWRYMTATRLSAERRYAVNVRFTAKGVRHLKARRWRRGAQQGRGRQGEGAHQPARR
jgi:hypothetical protein